MVHGGIASGGGKWLFVPAGRGCKLAGTRQPTAEANCRASMEITAARRQSPEQLRVINQPLIDPAR